jgi:cytoskeletal protein CcmA (bactofilin family)
MFEKRKGSVPLQPTTGQPGEPDAGPRSTAAFNARITATIGPTIKIKGDVTGDENLVIEGTVDGLVELAGHDLTIGQSGHVMANLVAKTVKIEGRVTGDVTGSEKVILSKSGRVEGNIVAPRVTLEDGAKFKGSIDMDPGAATPASTGTFKRAANELNAGSVAAEGAQTTA